MDQSKKLLMKINASLCVHCGACSYLCATGTIALKGTDPTVDKPEQCTNCGLCEEICPTGAISLPFFIKLQANALLGIS
ncbi:MAG: 4Fe-4S ferredoxin [Chloroflexi bacterium HGW-Chloroflexi-4]|nr:MAG: 4Fe-4S ferredoxin [Chloroflexi bacterium HGW-Chloroflexi-4]